MYWTYSFFPLFHILGIVLCVWIVIMILRSLGNPQHHRRTRGDNAALDLLKERYVKGEISRDEFNAKKADLLD